MNNVWPLPRIVFQDLASVQETRPTALITEATAWGRVDSMLKLPVVVQAEPTRQDREFVEELAHSLPSASEVIYVVGDGLLCDVGRFVSFASRKPLVIVPTALATDEPFVATSTLTSGDRTAELPTGAANEVIIDFDVIRAASPALRAAAIVDVLSIFTGLMDWTYAQDMGHEDGAKLLPWVAGVAAQIAGHALKIAPALGTGDSDALRDLVILLCLTVQIDNQLGHRRLSQGSEHIFANALLLNDTVVDVSHAERVAAGILLATTLHGKDVSGLRGAMEAAGVRVGQVKPNDVRETFLELPEYARSTKAPYTLLNDLQNNSAQLIEALTRSTLLD
ncbi:MAG: iron-containing alcohol dehydrogenase [Anaerolineae bacterium]